MLLLSYKINKAVTPTKNEPPPIKKKGKPIITQSAKWYKIMERIKELEKELEKVCGKYENDCSKCPKQAECEEYCKLAQIYEIVNR